MHTPVATRHWPTREAPILAATPSGNACRTSGFLYLSTGAAPLYALACLKQPRWYVTVYHRITVLT